MAIKEIIKENKKFVIIWVIVIWVIIAILFGLKYMGSNYAEENNLQSRDQLILQYGVNEAIGDKLLTCHDGSYDVYRPNDGSQIVLCGSPLSEEVVKYLDTLK